MYRFKKTSWFLDLEIKILFFVGKQISRTWPKKNQDKGHNFGHLLKKKHVKPYKTPPKFYPKIEGKLNLVSQ